MTKKEAIEEARKLETYRTYWSDKFNMWHERTNPLTASGLKKAKIARALTLLGWDQHKAAHAAFMTDKFEGLTFREAVYSVKIEDKK